MTILQLISSEGYYGAESMLVALARGLSDLGHRSIVGVFRDSRSPHTEVGDEAKRQGLAVDRALRRAVGLASGGKNPRTARGIRRGHTATARLQSGPLRLRGGAAESGRSGRHVSQLAK